MPFKTGMLMSRIATFGGISRASRKASCPLAASPATLNTFVLHKGFYALTNKLVIFSNQYGNGHSKSP